MTAAQKNQIKEMAENVERNSQAIRSLQHQMRAIALDDIRQALGTITKQIPFFAKKDVQLKLETEVTESKKDLFTQLEAQQNYVERLLKDVERNMTRVEKNQTENQQTLTDNLDTVKRIELTIQSMRRNNAGGALKQKLTMMSQANQQQNESQENAEGGQIGDDNPEIIAVKNLIANLKETLTTKLDHHTMQLRKIQPLIQDLEGDKKKAGSNLQEKMEKQVKELLAGQADEVLQLK